jgi:spore coat protein CotH
MLPLLTMLGCAGETPLSDALAPAPRAEGDTPGDPAEDVPGGPTVGGDTGEPLDGDPVDGGARLFSHEVVHDIEIELDAAAWDHMDRDHTAVVEAEVTVDGETYVVGLRRRGSSTLRGMDDKAGFNVDFGEWDEEADYHGVRHVALTNMVFDESMMREHLAYWLYAQMGVAAPRHGYARVSVNGERFGLYGVLEGLDQRFVDRHWGYDREGFMYDSLWNLADLTALGVGYFSVQEEGGVGRAFDDLNELAAAAQATLPGGGWELLGEHFDRDAFLRGQGAEIAMGHYDSYWYNTNNYLLYRAPRSDRWYMIPWGQDQAFGGNGSAKGPFKGILLTACVADGTCSDALEAEVRRTAHAMLDLDLKGYLDETWALVQDDCRADPRREKECDPGKLYDFVDARPQTIFREIGE